MTGDGSMDTIVQVWWLEWTAYALSHAENIFLPQWLNYPAGQNFGVNGSFLALGVVFMPITKLFGPVVAWNIALRLTVAVSATSMCLVLRRWTTWWPAAFLGGLLYGFSAYATWYSTYLFILCVPLPPLIFLLLHEILVRQRWRPGRTGALLGAICVVQFFISTEILASTVVMGAIATALFAIIYRRDLISRWRYAVAALAYCLGVGCLLLSFPVWFTFAGPEHINGPPAPTTFLAEFPSDLLATIVPTFQWLSPNVMALGPSIYDSGEMYLGLPLVLVLACFAVFFRKRRTILFAGAMALIAFILSLGPLLYVGDHATAIRLPFSVLQHIPVAQGLFASRFSLYTVMFTGGMFAIGIDELWRRSRRSGRFLGLAPSWNMAGALVATAAITAAVAIPLIPGYPPPASRTNVPKFFTSDAVDAIPPGSVVLAYPYPDIETSVIWSIDLPTRSIMLDQAVAGMRFKVIGGYGWFPSSTGQTGTTGPSVLEPQSVQALFDVAFSGMATPAQQALLSKSNLTADLREFLRTFHVQTVIVLHLGKTAALVSHVTDAIGPPVKSGGVTVWFHVKQRLAAVAP